jgi:hypothetical protein
LASKSPSGSRVAAGVEDADLNLPSYGLLVTGMIEKQVTDHASALIDARLAEDIRELLNIAPAEIKLSEIAKGMIEGRHDDGYPEVQP